MTTDAQVREFLRRLRAPAPEVMRAVFTRGGCYALHEILQAVFPDAEAWQSCRNGGKLDGDHVLAHIDGKFYDIVGQVKIAPHIHIQPYKEKFRDPWNGHIVYTNRRQTMFYRRMTPAECRKARKWSPVCWDQVVRK